MGKSANWVRVAAVKQVRAGEMLAAEAGGKKLAIVHLDDDTWHATDNVCTHAFALLTDGWLEGDAIECPLHAGRFDVRTGAAMCPPVEKDLATYKVKIEGADVFVALPG